MAKVLITGANRGLGLELVKLYLSKGYEVYGTSRKAINITLSNATGKFTNLVMDVSSEKSVEEASKKLREYTQDLDVIINNAGVHFDASNNRLEDFDFDAALETLNINSLGPLRVSKHFLPFLNSGEKKVLVNISSEAGSIGNCWRKAEYDYCMSKAALNMESVILQNYVKKDGIKVLSLHPGWMRTDMGGEDADISPLEAAKGIDKIIEEYKSDMNSSIYMDYNGKVYPW